MLDRSILETAGEGIVSLDARGSLTYVNPAAAELLGALPKDLLGRDARDFWVQSNCYPQVDNWSKLPIQQIMDGDIQLSSGTAAFKRSDDTQFPVEFLARPLIVSSSLKGIVLTFHDITEKLEGRRALEESESQFRELSENSLVGVYVIQEDIFTYVNPRLAEIFGYKREEIIGKMGPLDLSSPESRTGVKTNVEKRISGEVESIHYMIRGLRKDGTKIDVELFGNRSLYHGTPGVIGTLLDITSRIDAEGQIQYQAYYDTLTGLPNRRLFNDRLDHALKTADRQDQKLALLCLDLDRFKQVNDSLGHETGDALLRSVCARIQNTIHDNDTLARLGGDELAIVLERIEGVEMAAAISAQVLALFEKPFDVGPHKLFIAASMGISIYPEDGETGANLVKHADAAMYTAKKQGGAAYEFYRPAMTASSAEWLELETALRRAVEQKQLRLYFQPQVDLRSGKIIGAEALVRWLHPDKGLISPIKFIPIAEATGQIVEVGDWVIKEACRHLRNWQADGLTIEQLAINLSGVQVVRGDVVDSLRQAIEETGIDPSMLELEITENSIMEYTEDVQGVLLSLRNLGVSLAIDDFGTGYSSLSYLKQLPIDKLKIDRSFVMGIPEDTSDIAIIKAVISLGNVLGLEIVAEGVEKPSQRNIILENGCHIGQGYLFSPPLPAEEFTDFVRKNRLTDDTSGH